MLRIDLQQFANNKRPSITTPTLANTPSLTTIASVTTTTNTVAVTTTAANTITTSSIATQEQSKPIKANSINTSQPPSLVTSTLISLNSSSNGSQSALQQNHRSIITSSQLKCMYEILSDTNLRFLWFFFSFFLLLHLKV